MWSAEIAQSRDRVRVVTDERFAKEYAEERAAMRARLAAVADELRETERIAAGVGTQDMQLAGLIKSLGFDGDSSRVFDLLPLIHVPIRSCCAIRSSPHQLLLRNLLVSRSSPGP